MIVSMIAALANNRVIGLDNKMPWHLPAELQLFKRATLGKPIVMGRNTFESIGRPLPGRLNIVLSRQTDYKPKGVTVVATLDDAVVAAGDVEELMIIGGATIYNQCLAAADRLYLTHIELTTEGDTWFPDYEQYNWQEIEHESYAADDKNPHDYRFSLLERVK
ncbi:Dihydrofolate reductase [Moritella sp. JT01]|uniref:type 3 dihydrofolate reductase n=1 Tax=Moritella sp. JT01 TaxID=756698 RepID=UPI0007927AF2|nr:type 3 dihydrofolate reductase [Moritella sp. JT01]KXO11954.1 Dihydrofolate reductase [Moritella sp. JT01]